MNFKTQISTTREQSERLVELDVKPETADMCFDDYGLLIATTYSELKEHLCDVKLTPSWSLSRLLEMMPKYIDKREEVLLMIEPPIIAYYDTQYKGRQHFTTYPNIFENCISMIDWLIRNGHFNKKYLIENP